MKTLGARVIFGATAQAGPTLSLVHTDAGSYGAQEAGKDAGPLCAFVRIDSATADTLTLLNIVVEREGKPCSAMTKLERIATIPAIEQTLLLRVDADKGTPFKGALAKDATWLRIEAVMDHQGKAEAIDRSWSCTSRTAARRSRSRARSTTISPVDARDQNG